MNTEIINYLNYGRVIKITTPTTIVMVTIDVGPRIIYYGSHTYNFMKIDVDRKLARTSEFFDEHYGKGTVWYNYGGHRLWKSPEDMFSYSVDNTPVQYIEKENSIKFLGKGLNSLEKNITITLIDDNSIEIEHEFVNKSFESIEVAIWALTVLRVGGVLYVPLNTKNTGLLPCRNIVYWDYTNPKDSRFELADDYISVEQKDIKNPFKIGLYTKIGKAYYHVDNMLFEKKFEVVENGNYADFCCNFETYTNEKFLECETLGEVKVLEPNQSSTHTEIWNYRNFDGSYIDI